MNLLEREVPACSISLYRTFQYGYISEFFNDVIPDYINKHLASLDSHDYVIQDEITYRGHSRSILENHILTLKYKDDDKEEVIRILMPSLIEDTFFIIQGNYYVPAIYITDEPICVKRRSVNLYSLFCPITFYYRENRAIILGRNIPINRFFHVIFEDKNLVEELISNLNLEQLITEDLDQARLNFRKVLPIPDDESIPDYLSNLFFDKFTKQLYKSFYNIDDIRDVIKLSINKFIKRHEDNNRLEFINLKQKRLVFSEVLLRPVFRCITNALSRKMTNRKHEPLKINEDIVLAYYVKDLGMNYLYDLVNGFSSIISHKATFKLPGLETRLPQSVSSIHPTYKGRICPVSVSDKEPGVAVSLIATQEIDFKFGRFIIDDQEL